MQLQTDVVDNNKKNVWNLNKSYLLTLCVHVFGQYSTCRSRTMSPGGHMHGVFAVYGGIFVNVFLFILIQFPKYL